VLQRDDAVFDRDIARARIAPEAAAAVEEDVITRDDRVPQEHDYDSRSHTRLHEIEGLGRVIFVCLNGSPYCSPIDAPGYRHISTTFSADVC
jgi:hypothetical protein